MLPDNPSILPNASSITLMFSLSLISEYAVISLSATMLPEISRPDVVTRSLSVPLTTITECELFDHAI